MYTPCAVKTEKADARKNERGRSFYTLPWHGRKGFW